MSILTLDHGDKFLATGAALLQQHGIQLRTGSDFEEYRQRLAEGRPDHLLGAPFDPQVHRLTKHNAFWIIGTDSDGTIMHTQAMRMLHLRNRSLGEYLRYGFRQFPPSGVDIDLGRSRYRAGPGSRNMYGSVCYHGEYWIGGTEGQYRGAGWSTLLGRMAFLMALKTWSPDYVFGFMAKAVAYKGFMARHGYMHAEPGALRWYMRGKPDPIEGFMVWMSNEDLRYILDMPLTELELTEYKKAA